MSDTHLYVRAADRAQLEDIAHRDEGWNDEAFRRHELDRAYMIGMERAKIEDGTATHAPTRYQPEFVLSADEEC